LAFLTTERGNFFYEERGASGPVLFLLHGLTSNHGTWDKVLAPLTRLGFHLFAFDMRGHGQSDWPVSGYSPDDHGFDVDACARALGYGQIHVAGHSTGGRNALVFADLFPASVRTLTIIDQTLTADPESWKKYQTRYQGYPVPFPDEKSLEDFLRSKFPADDRRFDYYKSQFSPQSNGGWNFNFSIEGAWETQRLGRATDSYARLSAVKAPTLFVKGADSRYVSMEEARRIEKSLMRGRLAVVEKAEHAVQRDNPEGLLAVLGPFLQENQG
jgi:esterase